MLGGIFGWLLNYIGYIASFVAGYNWPWHF